MLRVSQRFGRTLVVLLVVALQGAVGAASDPTRDRFPDVVLTTHEGRTVRFYSDLVKGKIVAINLIYTSCRYACPLETAKLAQVQRLLGERMGRDVFFYSITIDPEHDTPAVLKEYAQRFRAGPGWLFLTGARADIELIGTKLALYATASRANLDGHMPYLLVGNAATGQWMRNSAVDNPRFIARTIGDWLNNWEYSRRSVVPSSTEIPRVSLTVGEYAFGNRCAPCHTIGGGDSIGPDLGGVTTIRDRTWLARMIREPDKLVSERDPAALALRAKYRQLPMPNLGVTEAEALALIDYIEEESRRLPKAGLRPVAAHNQAKHLPDLTAVVAAYLRIHQALYADTLRGASAQARMIASTCATARAPDQSICSAAAALVDASDLSTARAAFEKLGIAIMSGANGRIAELGTGVRIAYCPMLRKYWLQSGDEIMNPFYGARMPHCGYLAPNAASALR